MNSLFSSLRALGLSPKSRDIGKPSWSSYEWIMNLIEEKNLSRKLISSDEKFVFLDILVRCAFTFATRTDFVRNTVCPQIARIILSEEKDKHECFATTLNRFEGDKSSLAANLHIHLPSDFFNADKLGMTVITHAIFENVEIGAVRALLSLEDVRSTANDPVRPAREIAFPIQHVNGIAKSPGKIRNTQLVHYNSPKKGIELLIKNESGYERVKCRYPGQLKILTDRILGGSRDPLIF